ncbi:MAG TPA: DinB family protein [Dehalococcoidia bacterium]|nr:DinB family protein [Dehalococcoidia bacterium]
MPERAPEAETLLARLNRLRRETHDGVLRLADELTDEQLRRRPGPLAPSIGFHVWHLARWADHDRALIDGTPQIWESRDLATAWNLTAGDLGKAKAGTEMSDDASETLTLPPKDALLEYTKEAFDALDATLGRKSPDDLYASFGPQGTAKPLADYLFVFLTHDNRHLGMIEALRGMLGLKGTASN